MNNSRRIMRQAISRLFRREISSAFSPVTVPVAKGIVSPMLTVDPIRDNIFLPNHAKSGVPGESPDFITTYSEDEIPKVRKAARLARKMLEFANSLAKPGVTTDEIDRLTHHEIIRNGAYPTPLNYYGFPKSICSSVNEVVCHGIPDNRPLCDGDILSIDVSLYTKDGYHGDNCGSVIVGKGDESLNHLVESTKTAVDKAIAVCRPGACFSHIGAVIDEHAKSQGLSVIHEFCGHGTGTNIHMKPLVLHYRNTVRIPMRAGMVFTIEPILVQGSRKLRHWEDGWTASTFDGGRAAQIEHEVLVTEDGCEVLTIFEEEV
jgi:methionyl aminopeptidase